MADTTDEELLQEMREIAEELDKQNISKDDYYENRELSGDIKHRFGTWNKAKKEAGLELNNSGGYTKEHKQKLVEAAKKIANDSDKKNTVDNLIEKTGYSKTTIRNWFDPTTKVYESVGAEPYRKIKSDKEIEDAVENLVDDKKVVRPTDLEEVATRERLEEAGINIEKYEYEMIRKIACHIATNMSPGFYGVKEFREIIKKELGFKPFYGDCSLEDVKQVMEEDLVDESTVIKKHDSGKNTRIFVDKGKFSSEEKYRSLMKAKWDDYKLSTGVEFTDSDFDEKELFDLFIELTGTGKQASTIFASIAFVEADVTQADLEGAMDVTDVAIRNTYHMVEEELGKV